MFDDKITTYDELDSDEKEILDLINKYKLMKDHATFSLYRFQLAKLMEEYEKLKKIREDILMKFFSLYENIKEDNLLDEEIDVDLWSINRENEENIWSSELNYIFKIKNYLDNGIDLIESGEAEDFLIKKDNHQI